MTPEDGINFDRAIPVFPLADCIHLPHTYLPLHIFESRHRQMVGDVLDTSGILAMGMFAAPPDAENYIEGAPPIRPWVCIAQLCQYEPLDDGRFLVILKGLCRARWIMETPGRAYRRFRLVPGKSSPYSPSTLTRQLHTIGRLLESESLNHLNTAAGLRGSMASGNYTNEALTDIIASALCEDTEQRYRMLSELNPLARANWVRRHIELLQGQPASN